MAVPFWGPPTSYLNFCEEDYVISRYVGEFINSLSSLTFVLYGIYGLATSSTFPRGPRLVSYLGLMGVGICSGGYHMTLKYHTQMADELSMHLLTTPLIYRLLTSKATPERTRTVGIILSVLFTIVMVTHMVMDEFLLHATAFGSSVYTIASRGLRLSKQIPDPYTRALVRNASIFGCLSFATGYALWLIDEFACQYLIQARHAIDLPFAFLLEFHGWWHVLTAIGGYAAVEVVNILTEENVSTKAIDSLAWPVPQMTKLMTGRRASVGKAA